MIYSSTALSYDYTSECKTLWGEPEETPSFAILLYTRRRRSSLSVVDSECEALVISEVGAITTEELVARVQSAQRRGPERLECHDRVYCVCAHAQDGCALPAVHVDKPSLRGLSLMMRRTPA